MGRRFARRGPHGIQYLHTKEGFYTPVLPGACISAVIQPGISGVHGLFGLIFDHGTKVA